MTDLEQDERPVIIEMSDRCDECGHFVDDHDLRGWVAGMRCVQECAECKAERRGDRLN